MIKYKENKFKFLINKILLTGGIMQRFFRLSLLVAFFALLITTVGFAQKPQVYVSGKLARNDVRIFQKDSSYIFNNEYVVAGTLIIEPGTEIYFYPNGRLLDSIGGRIIADGDAKATYTAKPGTATGYNPIAGGDLVENPNNWTGYADLRYFGYTGGAAPSATISTITTTTVGEQTVHPTRYNWIFNVVLDTVSRKLRNLNYDGSTFDDNGNQTAFNTARHIIIPFEKALMFQASRMFLDPSTDANLNNRPWLRLKVNVNTNTSPDIVSGKIKFYGQPENNFSKEWGHIIILPGSRTAFFRNCSFEGFRKDTTVDRLPYFSSNTDGLLTADKNLWNNYNNTLKSLSNGSGGVITTFSSRTWILNCQFSNNRSFVRGGALQILQSPGNFPGVMVGSANPNTYKILGDEFTGGSLVAALGEYALNKNPNITNRNGQASEILTNSFTQIPRIELSDEVLGVDAYGSNDRERAAWDDARVAAYLGHFRNMTFTNNKAQLNNTGQISVGTPPVSIWKDKTTENASLNQNYGNVAFGGAIYISSNNTVSGSINPLNVGQEEYRKIEIGLGINNSLNIGGSIVNFLNPDSFTATGNEANNYQPTGSTLGARGGAIYVGKYTSLIVAGNFTSNKTQVPRIELDLDGIGTTLATYSMGGAIYTDGSFARLQVVGGSSRDVINNTTLFSKNSSGAGGAIFVEGSSSFTASPVIGGHDATLLTRDLGFNIVFDNNNAIVYGGAIFTTRNTVVQGAGGVANGELIGYGGKYPVLFNANTSGYSGGAISIHIAGALPLTPFFRNVEFTRALFQNNMTGNAVASKNIPDIRGGGAVYSLNSNVGLVKGVEFTNNTTSNGNGGALTLVHPDNSQRRFFVSDLDVVNYDPTLLVPASYTSNNAAFIKDGTVNYLADARMLTRFINNKVSADAATLASQSGSGVTQLSGGTVKTQDEIRGTYWNDDQTGYGVGTNGLIIKFTDGGNTWQYLNSGVTSTLNKVVFTTSNTGYVVGNSGILLKTTNSGGTWNPIGVDALTTPAPSVNNAHFTDVYFVGTQNGYVTTDNGYVVRTTDAFAAASIDNPTQQTTALNGVSMVSDKIGVMVGNGRTILLRSDVPPTYSLKVSPVNPNLNGIHFVSTTRGYAVGNSGTVLRTTNGGIDWTVLNPGTTSSFMAVQFITATKGFIVSNSGAVWSTNDGGDTWTNASGTLTSNGLNDINFVNNNVGFAVGVKGTVIKTIDGGTTWNNVGPVSSGVVDINRIHKGTGNPGLPENGVGLGGAIYLLDKVSTDRIGRADSVQFNRVRIQNNSAYTGSAIYSDNYDMKLIFNRSLVTGNTATSSVGVAQNTIKGPVVRDGAGVITENKASSDLVPTTIYGEVQGPLPASIFSEAANSIYNNNAKFLIRLPDAPNTKGALGGTGIGLGGTDTLRGNYWGLTEANVNVEVQHTVGGFGFTTQETFFVDANGTTVMAFTSGTTTNLTNQGPFESMGSYSYKAIPLANGATEDLVAANTIPENLLFSGKIYDLYDKGTDVKTADYSKRRMSPIEDFAVGIPTSSRTFTNALLPSYQKYVRRFVRDPYAAEAKDKNGNLMFPWISAIQAEWKTDETGNSYHPIGYPLWLETKVNYDGIAEVSNNDPNLLNETVYFVINQTTGDFIRTNMRQVSEDAPFRETFRSRVELVPDSSSRAANTFVRRTAEGLANFGTGSDLLKSLQRSATNEDKSALQGRKYDEAGTNFATDPNLLSNKPTFAGKATYFAGERYRALPVNIGDKIQVISRSALWNQTLLNADNGSMTFTVTNSTMPPLFTGNVIKLQKDTVIKVVPSELPSKRALGIPDTIKIVELLHRVAVTEDRNYPVSKGTYSSTTTAVTAGRGTDSIMTITAKDTNKFYDPRALINPNKYTQLTYTWSVDPASGLNNWLGADTVVASVPNSAATQNPRDLALGYIKLKGRAINPYVVPGGENVTVTAANYPPNYRTIYALRDAKASGSITITDEEISKFINLYSTYLHAPQYDGPNARFLQQDTVDVGRNFVSTYNFKINVVDSIPSILDENTTPSTIIKPGFTSDTLVVYQPTVFTCDKTADGRLKANVTDKLRFQMDLNTDDELEDFWAEKTKGWAFPYGRTAYGFLNLTNQGGLTDVDTTFVWNAVTNKYEVILNQSKPFWMEGSNLKRYATDATVDQFGQDFSTSGKLNVRIDSALALQYLTPLNATNGALNTDTSFTVVINDGHSGLTRKKFDLFINFQPKITTTSLPAAKEDFDYNPQLLDSNRMIKVVDPNFGQKRSFELIYSSYASNTISKDPCYSEAGVWDVTTLKVTPQWLKINPDNGLLYGKPGIKDAPASEKVVVLVRDAEGLTDLKVLDLRVDSTSHAPSLAAAPSVSCIDLKSTYTDSLTVIDLDLERDPNKAPSPETLTLTVVSPSGLAIEPASISGPRNRKVKVSIKSLAGFNPPRDNDGKITIKVAVSDGITTDILTYRLKVSDESRFVSRITVKNSEGGQQILEWGTAEKNVTTGDGTDNFAIGRLDSNYCEYELPPYPTTDIFDTRWTIPSTNGTVRNIYPSNVNKNQIYFAQIQPGDVQGSGSKVYPIRVNWDITTVPAASDKTKNPTGATWYLRDALSNGSLFNVNMNTGDARFINGFVGTKTGNNYELQINNTSTKAFVIYQDWNSDVAESGITYGNKINTVSPNPVSNEAMINFELSTLSLVKIEVVDILGNTVATIVNGQYAPGQYNIQWFDADKLSTGSYIVKMTSGINTDSFPVNVVK